MTDMHFELRLPATEPCPSETPVRLIPLRGPASLVARAAMIRTHFAETLHQDQPDFLRQVAQRPYEVQGKLIVARRRYVAAVLSVDDAAWWVSRQHEDPATGRWLTCPDCDRSLLPAEFRLARRAGCCSRCGEEARAAA